MDNRISQAIEQVILEQSLTGDALRKFTSLNDEVKSLEDKNKRQAESLDNKISDIQTLTEQVDSLKLKITSFENKEQELQERESKIFELEKQTAVEMAKSTVYQETFNTIFRNTTIRENINKNVSRSGETYGNDTINEDRSITKE